MTSMRWESCRASPQHQCLPWTAASAIYTHRQLLKLVQPAYRAPLQPLRDNTLQQLPSCNSRILQSALQQLQPTSNDTCKQISRHRSLTDRYGTVLGSVGTSHSNEAVQTTTPGGYQPSGSQGDNDDDDPFNANFGGAFPHTSQTCASGAMYAVLLKHCSMQPKAHAMCECCLALYHQGTVHHELFKPLVELQQAMLLVTLPLADAVCCADVFAEAVLVLREDLPFVFQQDMRYHIFREDITFR